MTKVEADERIVIRNDQELAAFYLSNERYKRVYPNKMLNIFRRIRNEQSITHEMDNKLFDAMEELRLIAKEKPEPITNIILSYKESQSLVIKSLLREYDSKNLSDGLVKLLIDNKIIEVNGE